MNRPSVALVSADLLFASRLRAALAGTTEVRMAGADVPGEDIVFVDLNDAVGQRLELISSLRARGARVIAFCNHEDREVRIRAVACGAEQVVTNGSLQQAALRLLATAGRA